MIERFKTYCETLEGLSTEELDRSADKLVRAEKRNVALVIAHIAEMSRRKGHLERGYKNLFGYCTRRLHLSEGSVALRIQVANVSRRFPQILVALAENRMSLTVAGLLTHGRDHGAGPGHRPRQEGPEEKTCTATPEGGETERRSSQEKILSGQDFRGRAESQLPLHPLRGSRARPRKGGPPV